MKLGSVLPAATLVMTAVGIGVGFVVVVRQLNDRSGSYKYGHYTDQTNFPPTSIIKSVRQTLKGSGLIHARTLWFSLDSGKEVILFLSSNGDVQLRDAPLPDKQHGYFEDISSTKWQHFVPRPLSKLQDLLFVMNAQNILCRYDFSTRNCATFVHEIFDKFYDDV